MPRPLRCCPLLAGTAAGGREGASEHLIMPLRQGTFPGPVLSDRGEL